MTVYGYNQICNFIVKNPELIENVKVTKAEKIGFNEMEGNEYLVNLSVTTKEGYKNRRLKMLTNSSYVDDFEDWDDNASLKDNFQAIIDYMGA